jgi:hypothetical protein
MRTFALFSLHLKQVKELAPLFDGLRPSNTLLG